MTYGSKIITLFKLKVRVVITPPPSDWTTTTTKTTAKVMTLTHIKLPNLIPNWITCPSYRCDTLWVYSINTFNQIKYYPTKFVFTWFHIDLELKFILWFTSWKCVQYSDICKCITHTDLGFSLRFENIIFVVNDRNGKCKQLFIVNVNFLFLDWRHQTPSKPHRAKKLPKL